MTFVVQHAQRWRQLLPFLSSLVLAVLSLPAGAQDLAEIRAQGVLRHLGVPYARFVVDKNEGLDVELVQLFAKRIGVRYEYVPADWNNVIQDLIGQEIDGQQATGKKRPIRGDLIANGLTILPSRGKLIDYSQPTFPSAVWLLARTDSPIKPIKPTGNLLEDIKLTKERLKRGTTFVMENTCLDPRLYDLVGKGYALRGYFKTANANDLVPAIVKKESEMTLLDVPDIIVAMEKWQGQIKVIGPISEEQLIGAGFRKSSPQLRAEFDRFISEIKQDGTYMRLIQKYFKTAPLYLPQFFSDPSIKQ